MDLRQQESKNTNSSPMATPILPAEIIRHVISFLSVKEIHRMKTVCKSWNTFISDSSFIKMHLNKSTPLPTMFLGKYKFVKDTSVLPFPAIRLPLNMSASVPQGLIVGCCNGLVCFRSFSLNFFKKEMWFKFWNPATQKESEKWDFSRDPSACSLKLAFGYDYLTDSYKIVAMHLYGHYSKTSSRNEVKLFDSRDKVWRSLESFPAIPLGYNEDNAGVFMSGALNWLAVHSNSGFIDWNTVTVKEFVIVSLDLATETYSKFLPPMGFDAVPLVEPAICAMTGCLCFVHDVEQTHFVIWKMLEFGVEKSWTLYFKINYQNLHNGDVNMSKQLLPMCLSKNGDALVLANVLGSDAFIYYWNDNRTEHIKIPSGKWQHWHAFVKDYVESLVPVA